MKYILSIAIALVLVLSASRAQSPYQNIKIGSDNKPNELSVAINPNNMNHIIMAANIDNYYFSFDGGLSWNTRKQESKFGIWGDPCVAFDAKDNIYYFHLALTNGYSNDRMVCQKSTDGGISWNALDTFVALNSPQIQDKEWASVDVTNSKFSGNIYLMWTQCGQGEYGEDGTREPDGERKTDIFVSSSTNEGVSWSPVQTINKESGSPCNVAESTVLGVTSCIGPEGEVYACWESGKGMIFDRSIDGGANWLYNDILVDSLKSGFRFNVPGIYRVFGFPSIACDRSGGIHNGRIYISWNDQRNGKEDTDIWICYSDDGGFTWTKAGRVNDDNTKTHQFFNNMTVDQATGFVYNVFYDRRDHSGSETDVYLAKSMDGGQTFANVRISEKPFIPDESTFFGDYISIAARNGEVRPVWTRLDTNELSVWTAIINEYP